MVQQIDVNGSDSQLQLGSALAFDSSLHHEPASNTAAVVTVAADATHPIILSTIWCSYTATPTSAASIKVEDGSSNKVWLQYLPEAGPYQFTFDPPLQGTRNTALIVTLAAAGSGISGVLDINARTHK